MRRMREHLEDAEKLRYELQRQAWFVTAVESYVDAVRALADDLATARFGSDGFIRLRGYLAEYTASEPFRLLLEDTSAVQGRSPQSGTRS